MRKSRFTSIEMACVVKGQEVGMIAEMISRDIEKNAAKEEAQD